MDEDDNYQDKRCQTYLVDHNTKIASEDRLYRYLFIYLLVFNNLVKNVYLFTAIIKHHPQEVKVQSIILRSVSSEISQLLTQTFKKVLRWISYGAGPQICESRHSPFLARNANENPASETRRPLATSSLAVGRFAAKKGSLRSPRGRLVASLLIAHLYLNFFISSRNHNAALPVHLFSGYLII